MECQTQIHSLNSRIVSIISSLKKPPNLCSFLVLLPTTSSVQKFTLFSSYNNVDKTHPLSAATVTEKPVTEPDIYTVKFKTLGSCKLGISRFPEFVYNAEGGAATGSGIGDKTKSSTEEDGDGEISINFDLKTLFIPPLTTATTKFLGLPLPPFLRIDIAPEMFQGTINPDTGKVDLEFHAKFIFSVGTIYRAPPLLVKTVLTTEESRGTIRKGTGEKLDEEGRCRLVGVSTVQPIDDIFMNTFLGLPSECIADLNAIISCSFL